MLLFGFTSQTIPCGVLSEGESRGSYGNVREEGKQEIHVDKYILLLLDQYMLTFSSNKYILQVVLSEGMSLGGSYGNVRQGAGDGNLWSAHTMAKLA